MKDKITNFLEMSKTIDAQILPIEKDVIMKNISEIPSDIASAFSKVMTDYVEEVLITRNIVSSIGNPHLCRHLIDSLDQTQLSKLNKIVLHLASSDPSENIKEITEASLGVTIPTLETLSKVQILIDHLKTLDIDYDAEAKTLATDASHFRLLADALILLNMGEKFEELLFDRLSQLPENDLDQLIEKGLQYEYNNESR